MFSAKRLCTACKQSRFDCDCWDAFSRKMKQIAFFAGFVMALLSIGCSSPQERAAQFGTRDLALSGVAVSQLCQENEEPFQVHGQKYSAKIPVIDQQFQLGVSQVVCCSKDACRIAGESNLFPRPQLTGAAEMIEQWTQTVRNHVPTQMPSMPSPRSFNDGVQIPVYQ